jgi:hypothetical protein
MAARYSVLPFPAAEIWHFIQFQALLEALKGLSGEIWARSEPLGKGAGSSLGSTGLLFDSP